MAGLVPAIHVLRVRKTIAMNPNWDDLFETIAG
jgi:hypothetical protein